MSYTHAIRITLPFEDCSGIISQWSDRSQRAIVYQHDADEKISKTHVHIGLYGCEVKAEQLKRLWKNCPGKGNEFWSWKEEADEFLPDGTNKYLTYMSKGKLAPVFVKNISNESVENSRLSWVEPVKADKTGDASEHVIKKVIQRFNLVKDSRYFKDDDEIIIGPKYNLELLLDNVRTEAFKVLWGEHRRVPHASHYKIVAGTAFLRICEEAKCFEHGVGILKNLWY